MLRSKNLTKILSLVIAIILWTYVMAVENPPTTERISGVSVELQNVASLTHRGLTIVSGDNATVDVIVSGTRADISRYKDQIAAEANVFGFDIGDNQSVRVDVHTGPLTLVEVRPARIRIDVESIVSVHKPVTLSFTGEPESNTEPGSITLQPELVELTGPQSFVESVSRVRIEIPYDDLRREETLFTVEALAVGEDGEPVPRVSLSSDTISVRATLYDIKEVPLHIEVFGEVDERFEMTRLEVPETISIRGSKANIEGIEFVEARPIDISGVELTSQLPVHPILPDNVEVASGSYGIHVGISIRGISSRNFEFESQDIEIRGIGEGLQAYINTPTINLRAAGIDSVIEMAEKEDFTLYVNIEEFPEGSHVVMVSAEHELSLQNIVIEPYEVYITIRENSSSSEMEGEMLDEQAFRHRRR